MNKFKIVISLILLSFLFHSCFIGKAIETGKMRKAYTIENKAIPPDFGENESEVLLIQMTGLGRDRFTKKATKKRYEGSYELVKPGTDIDKVYPDKKKYRYFFGDIGGTSYTYSNGGGGRYKRYYVYDRLKDQPYSSGAQFSFYAHALKVYMDELNKVRIKNKTK